MPNTDLEGFYSRYIAGLNARDWAMVRTLIADNVNLNGRAYKREDVSLEDGRIEVGGARSRVGGCR